MGNTQLGLPSLGLQPLGLLPVIWESTSLCLLHKLHCLSLGLLQLVYMNLDEKILKTVKKFTVLITCSENFYDVGLIMYRECTDEQL